MTCIPLAQLRSFRRRELGEDERRQVELHLSQCRSCRRILVDDLRRQEAEEESRVPEPIPEEILLRLRRLVPAPRRFGARVWLPLAAVVVAVIGGLLLSPKTETTPGTGPVLRDLDPLSGRLELLEPAASAEVRGRVRFRWTPVANARAYRLVVLGDDGVRLLERQLETTEVEVDVDGLSGLDGRSADVYWLVEAQMPGGEQQTSPPRPMTVAGLGPDSVD